MKDYQRLTVKNVGRYTQIKDDYSTFDCLRRLAELEDKIENGTLVDLPCKAGDTIYEVFKNHKPPFIQQTKVAKIIVTEKGLKLKLARNSVYETSIASLGKTLFLTETEALKKIKSV
nr:MAG TPA: hypothetical protein [Caudoviricetes sp.]